MLRTTERIDFRAMGTEFFCIAVEPPIGLFDSLYELTQKLESKWTRFNDSSELMKLNNAPGVSHKVSPETIRLLLEMKNGFEITDGLFDPNILKLMVDNGFAASRVNPEAITKWDLAAANDLTILDVEIDVLRETATLPNGIGLDAGGIGKGLAADLLASVAMESGAMGIAIFAGGDVAVKGVPPEGEGWSISISDPRDTNVFISQVNLSIGGMATSSPTGWVSTSGNNHILDMTARTSSSSKVVQATVLANAAVHAEVLTKMCFGSSIQRALELVELAGGQALLVDIDYKLHETTDWKKFT